jgi:glycerate kinase
VFAGEDVVVPDRTRPRKVLAAPDAFKGTATAAEIAAAIATGATHAGWETDQCPLSDGGEGFLDVLEVLGGETVRSVVTGPLGAPVEAEWRNAGDTAVVESARASGLVLAGGPAGNDPVAATSRGTGELIAAALRSGATRVLVGVGGSATTDGGLGALEAIDEAGGIGEADLLVACDVTVRFVDAARIFGPQKGASPVQVELLERRLTGLLAAYRRRRPDLGEIPGAGAAGGLAGGLVVAGARVVPGFDLVAGLVGLDSRMAGATIVISGEGAFDATSWEGKVVAGVARRCSTADTDLLVIAGRIGPGALSGVPPSTPLYGSVDLSEVFGADTAISDPQGSVALAAEAVLSGRSLS